MTFKQKVEHLFTYYSYILVILAILIYTVWFICNASFVTEPPTLLNGTTLDLSIDEAGVQTIHDIVTEGGTLDGTSYLNTLLPLQEAYIEARSLSEDVATYLTTQMYARSLDYILISQTVLDYLPIAFLNDMREVIPQEVLDRWPLVYKENLITCEQVPIGVKLEGTAFQKEHVISSDIPYITMFAGIANPDAFIRLVDSLLQ